MKLNTIVFGALIALSTSALQASEVKSNGDVKQPEILASVSTDKVVSLTAQEAKDTRGSYAYNHCTMNWQTETYTCSPYYLSRALTDWEYYYFNQGGAILNFSGRYYNYYTNSFVSR